MGMIAVRKGSPIRAYTGGGGLGGFKPPWSFLEPKILPKSQNP